MFKNFMSDINLEFLDKTEEYNQAKYIRKFMEDWASLIRDSSSYYDKIHDSSVNYLEPLDDVVILDSIDSSQISLTFKYDYDLIENE